MATPGSPINYETVVPLPRAEVMRRLQMTIPHNIGSYFDGTTVRSDGDSTLILERRFVPQWAIIVAVVGFLAAFIGLLALLVRTTETAYIRLLDVPGGTKIQVAGSVGPNESSRIQLALSGLAG